MKQTPAKSTALLLVLLYAASSLSGQEFLLENQELLLHYDFDEAPAGEQPTIDRGTALPRVDGRFFVDATRTDNTPGGASVGALDVTGSGHILANYGNPNVASLDGKLDNLNQTTITLWVNLQAEPRLHERIFATGSNGIGFQIINPPGVDGGDPEPLTASNFSLALDTADGTIPSYTNFDADNKWIFLAVTFDGTRFDEEQVQFYFGDPDTESSVVRSLSTLAWNATTTLNSHLFIGGHPNVANREINGYVDDFRIYRGVLTPEQIEEVRLENLQAVEPPPEFELIVRYNFDEASTGNENALDLGEVEPLIPARFFGDATRTGNTPGGASTGALDVSAPNAYALANHNDLNGKLDNLSAFTTTLWVNLRSDPRHLDRIFRAGNTGGFGFRTVEPASGPISASNFGLSLDIGSGNVPSGVDFDADDKWLFLAVTFDASADGQQYKFMAGDETTAVALRAAVTSTSIASTGVLDAVLSLGRHPAATSRIINAYLDDFRVYRGALDLEKIEAIRLENLGDAPTPGGYSTWAAEHFDSGEITDPSVSGPEATPSGDGVPNLLKYALGGTPRAPATDLLPQSGVDAETGFLTLTFFRPAYATDVDFVAETSSDLMTWNADAELISSVPVEGGTLETHRAPSGLETDGRVFLRLRVYYSTPD